MSLRRIDSVALSVSDLDRSIQFYTQIMGLTIQSQANSHAELGAGNEVLLRLHHQPGAKPIRRATGLYHFALLLPSRPALGTALRHFVSHDAPISGYSDHAVSEAIYLTDPDGHGIEVYRDRPRSEWQYPGGTLRMTVDPLDLEGVLEAAEAPWSGLPAETIMGHIHLQVASIAATEAFYTSLLGFDVVTRYGAAATFLSTDGYHHHIGANTWMGAGLAPAPDDTARLLECTIAADSKDQLLEIGSRLNDAACPVLEEGDDLLVTDPSGIRIRIKPD